jgi:outer membrane protein assembly factor BamB
MKKSITIPLLFSVLLISGFSDLFSQDWPQFRGADRDCKVTGFKAVVKWPQELNQVWKVNVGFADATPVLSGKKIYLNTRQGGDEVILCLDALTGNELWKNNYAVAAITGPSASAHPGPRSTPAVSNGKVVTFGVSGILSCLDANSGKLLWRKENPTNAFPTFYTGTSPLIVNNVCFIHVGRKDDGQILALDLNTGNEKWKWTGDGPAYASPSVMTIEGKKLLIVQTEKNLLALDFNDGKLLWQIPTPVQQRFYNCVSPYIDGQTIYYTGQGLGMKAIRVEKRSDNYVPKQLWANDTVGAKWNTPVLKDGFLYGFSNTRKIYCLNAATGQTAWIDAATNSDFATLVDCGSVLIGLPSTANLIVFKPDNKAYSEVAKYKVSETTIYSFPIVAGNNIYIKDAENLIMFKIN